MRSNVKPMDYRVVPTSGDAVTLMELLGGLGLPFWAYPMRRGARHALAVTWDGVADLCQFMVVATDRFGVDLAGRYAGTMAADWRGVGLTTYWPQATVERQPL